MAVAVWAREPRQLFGAIRDDLTFPFLLQVGALRVSSG